MIERLKVSSAPNDPENLSYNCGMTSTPDFFVHRFLRCLLGFLIAVSVSACSLQPFSALDENAVSPVSAETGSDAEESTDPEDGSFSVTMLDVGQGLSILLQADGHYLLYDGGGRDTSSYVVSYLQSHGITSLDYVVVSHYDDDHLAGLIGVLNTAAVSLVISPDYDPDTYLYSSFCRMVENKKVEEVHPAVKDCWSLGNAVIHVLAPESYDAEKENNNSIVMLAEYAGFRCLLMGDAESEEEHELLSSGSDLSADLLVAGHHGSSTSTGPDFLSAVSPTYVFISCGENNDYGHPHAETMEKLKNAGVKVFRSDLQGEVTISWKESEVICSTDPCTDYRSGSSVSRTLLPVYEESAEPEAVEDSGAQQYVLNTHTMKFHLPSCSSVLDIKETNKKYVTEDREQLMAEGYQPCGRCNP